MFVCVYVYINVYTYKYIYGYNHKHTNVYALMKMKTATMRIENKCGFEIVVFEKLLLFSFLIAAVFIFINAYCKGI